VHRTRLLPVALAAALSLALAACGSSSGSVDGVASLGTDPPDASAPSDSADNAGSDDGTDDDSGGDDATTTSLDPEDAALEFARCMREHGIDLPDPQVAEGPGGQGGGVMIQIDGEFDQEEMQAAQEACQPIMDDAFGSFEELDPEEVERMQEQMIEFAECMREHGVDFPDPVFDENGGMTVQVGGDDASGPPSDADLDKMQDAQEACQDEVGMDGNFGIAVGAAP